MSSTNKLLLTLILLLTAIASTSSFSVSKASKASKVAAWSRISASPYPWESTVDESEETLLKIRFAVQPGIAEADALTRVQQYTQAFPFAAILPVQPLQYLPTHDGGVDVQFLRKKTQQKGSVDGGIRFSVVLTSEGNVIELVAKRNSKGQTFPKIFAEKLVIQSFYDGISGKQDDRTGQAPTRSATVQSVYHKWLV
mmetsp:Transcript_13721/g.23365  ORF Transcript_13721/g.23365 Transcript_13721/m.23365 type:complete len:197 (-) Transcript_13721:462-1052(-)